MTASVVVKKSTYLDSVSLMVISTKANQIDGVHQAFVGMGTEMNKEVLRGVGLLAPEAEQATSGDLVIVVDMAADGEVDGVVAKVEQLLVNRAASHSTSSVTHRTIRGAASTLADANLAVIAVNGAYAVREAREAINCGLHVMLFSDNVSVADEVQLKRLAHDTGVLLMGPDCGTAIINGVALCFGNAVRRGRIGVVAASGTGAQEISVRIHEFGGGVSQLIGTGGRDMSDDVGGVMMLDGIQALDDDSATEVIVLVSKPPARAVEDRVLARIAKCSKPVVVCFVGGSRAAVLGVGASYAKNTKEAALAAVLLTGVDKSTLDLHPLNRPLIEEVRAKLMPEQQYIRGLFCGGTICDEAMYAALDVYDDVYSNIQQDPAKRLAPADASIAHTFLDFGDDAFTNGRPHPMIDPSLRTARFVEEARDPQVGVIVLDFILGYGSHDDPVGTMLPVITTAKQQAGEAGRHLEILAYILGTDLDTPNVVDQAARLEAVGVTIASSSANAGLLAREFVRKDVDG